MKLWGIKLLRVRTMSFTCLLLVTMTKQWEEADKDVRAALVQSVFSRLFIFLRMKGINPKISQRRVRGPLSQIQRIHRVPSCPLLWKRVSPLAKLLLNEELALITMSVLELELDWLLQNPLFFPACLLVEMITRIFYSSKQNTLLCRTPSRARG